MRAPADKPPSCLNKMAQMVCMLPTDQCAQSAAELLARYLRLDRGRSSCHLDEMDHICAGHVEGADRVKAKDTLGVGEHEYHVVAAVLMMLGLAIMIAGPGRYALAQVLPAKLKPWLE